MAIICREFLLEIIGFTATTLHITDSNDRAETARNIYEALTILSENELIESLESSQGSLDIFLLKIISNSTHYNDFQHKVLKKNTESTYIGSELSLPPNCFKIESGGKSSEIEKVCSMVFEIINNTPTATVMITSNSASDYEDEIFEKINLLFRGCEISFNLNYFKIITDEEKNAYIKINKGESICIQDFIENMLKRLNLNSECNFSDDLINSTDYADANLIIQIKEASDNFRKICCEKSQIIFTPLQSASRYNSTFKFFLNATSESIPGKPKNNPFIPTRLLRQIFQKRNINGEQLAFNHIIKAVNTSVESYFSYPLYNEDRKNHPHSLIIKLPEISRLDNQEISSTDGITIEKVEDDFFKATKENSTIKSSASVFDKYSQCSFLGSYLYHSELVKVATNNKGINSLAISQIVHIFLNKIWKHYKSSDQLINDDAARRERIFDDNLNYAMEEVKTKLSLPNWFAPLFEEKIRNLLNRFLALESTRRFKVKKLSHKSTVVAKSLYLDVMIDRIDSEYSSVDGKEIHRNIITDFKTGNVEEKDLEASSSTNHLFGILSLHKDYDGLTFSILREEYVGYRGIKKDSVDALNGEKTKRLNEQEFVLFRENWRKKIENVSDLIISGKSIAQPTDKDKCLNCQLNKVCRINENSN